LPFKIFIMRQQKYTTDVSLYHNEIPVALNQETGEIRPIHKRNNIPDSKEVFEPQGIFKKDYSYSWEFLYETLTPLELRIVMKLSLMAKINTNSLEPLNDSTTQLEIAEIFQIDHRKSRKIFEKLFKLGVYARFEAYKPELPYSKYWILNPYLSFSGKLIGSDIAKLFEGTTLTNEYKKKAKKHF
jgi:hypothetical protein